MKIYRQNIDNWYLERVIFLIAGISSLVSLILGFYVNQNWFVITILVGVMQIFFALSGYCPMAILLNKLGVKAK